VILWLIRHDEAGITPDHDSNPTIYNPAVSTPNPGGLSGDPETLDKPIPRLSSRNKSKAVPGQKEALEKNGPLGHVVRQSGGKV